MEASPGGRAGRSTVVAAVLFWSVAQIAEGQETGAPPTSPPDLTPTRTTVAPVIDGRVVDDPAYADATPARGFWQTTPDEGQPASQETEVYVVYDDTAIYFGVVLHDDDPETIVVAGNRRDDSLVETDSFQIILDTYHDTQTGFVFGTNPYGIQYDGQVNREGQGGFRGGGGFNRNWDGVWEVRARITEIGWVAEFAIPFRTLRYPSDQDQTWGLNFQRNIRRRNENAFWAPLPRQFNLYRLSLAGTLSGFEPPPQRNLKVTPYALVEWLEEGEEAAEREDNQEIGLDVKYSVTPSLTLDATVNTDFAQVEVDEFQINLDRFNLFFPEKRPFFLENAGYFSVGVPRELELFYSRRIGLGPDGEVIPIDYGLRLSGKAADKYNVGVLFMQTDELEDVAPENRFAVARISRDLPNRSSIGALFTGRKASGSDVPASEVDNYTYSIDGRWGIGENGLISGFIAQTETPGEAEDEHAFRLGGSFNSEDWSYNLFYTEIGEGFNPEVGFLIREGFRKAEGFLLRRFRPKDWFGIQELRPHISYTGYWDFDGFHETGFLHVDNHWEWKSGYEIHTGVNFTTEGLKEPFEIFEDIIIPPGTYDNVEGQIVFFTNRGAPFVFETRIVAGGFFDGHRVALSPGINFRLGEQFTTEVNWFYNDISLEGGDFETNLGRMRISYSFTPQIFVQALIQYNDVAEVWATNLRFGWLDRASTGLYVVYNEVRDIAGAGTGIPDRSLTIKYSKMFDLLR